jgi:hypothetical protein
VRVQRRRDGAVLKALVSVEPTGLVPGVPVLLIEGEMYGPDEVVGYLLVDASDGEEAELRRGGYTLARGACTSTQEPQGHGPAVVLQTAAGQPSDC